MKLTISTPVKALNKAYLRQSLKREQIELFKANLARLFDRIRVEEHEEHLKNIVADFFKDTWYRPAFEINTSKRADLVIHNGKTSDDSIGVIIETKKPSNTTEMISPERSNAKALHELLHYYMQERYVRDNKEIKHLIVCNIYEWYIFDAVDFERFFFNNQKLVRSYKDWTDGLLVSTNTDWFYQEIARPFIDKELAELPCICFDLRDFETIARNPAKSDDRKLINLYKLLSPPHLLKQPFANDSNSLNKGVETATFAVPTLPLADICYISVGMVVHADEKEAKGAFELADLVTEERDELHPKPFVEGKHLARWLPVTHRWLEWGSERAPALFRRLTFPELYEVSEKLLIHRVTGRNARVCYDILRLFCNHTALVCLPWQPLAGVRNKSLQKSARYADEKPRPDLPAREGLEAVSRRFGVKYLLAVMQSSVARDFLQSVRRSNTDLYPDDWKKLPIPDVPAERQVPVIALVDQILAAKKTDPKADISAFEAEIDRLVYSLYGLTEEEITVVEVGI